MKLLFIGAAVSFLTFLLTAFTSNDIQYDSGAPAGYTGSPGDGKDCTNCHGGSSGNVTGWITSNIPAQGYTADSTYTITATATGSGPKGFEISPQNSTGTQLGTLIKGSNNHLTGGTKYVTQNSGISSGTATWVFQWKAPAAGTGDVTFYGAFTFSMSVTDLCTLAVSEYVAAPLTVTATATPNHILAGDSVYLQSTPSGGSGSYTFSWSSSPVGFSSSLQNVYAHPLVSTIYTVEVNDGSNTASDTVHVTVDQNNGIGNLTSGPSIFINPNPSDGTFRVVIRGVAFTTGRITVYDLSGKEVFSEYISPAGQEGTPVNLGYCSRGVYLLKFSSGETILFKEVFVK